jgi:hypothetical protein
LIDAPVTFRLIFPLRVMDCNGKSAVIRKRFGDHLCVGA